MKSWLVWTLLIAAILGVVYFFSGMTSPAPTKVPQDPKVLDTFGTSDAPALQTRDDLPLLGGEVVLSTATNAKVGTYISGYLGITVYAYSKDTAGVSSCNDSCSLDWPPYAVSISDKLTVGKGVTGKIGSIRRSDDTLQVTYNGKPLYFYPKDLRPGDMLGNGQGGVWSIVKL